MELYSNILLSNLTTIKSEIVPTFDAFFYERESEIRRLIKQRWLLGKKPDGSLIGRYRDFEYADAKNQVNQTAGFGNVDLIDSGALWKGIEIFKQGDKFEVFSTDFKFDKISEKYGDENFNITDAETELLTNEIATKTIEMLYQKYLLK